jgi:hypothetical protein
MTYEELVAVLDDYDIGLSNGMVHKDLVFATSKALRAIVELHKPWSMETGPEGDSETETVIGCECIPQLPAFLNPWPCPTIQLIQNELND